MFFYLMTHPNAQGQANPFQLLVPFIVVFGIMWLLVIRPQKKEQNKRKLMLEALKKGDKIITNGGIVGKVMKIKDEYVEIKVDESSNAKITLLRTAILKVVVDEKKKS